MYEAFYGLRERPFNLLPDPRFLFLSRQHREALAHLQYGLTGRVGATPFYDGPPTFLPVQAHPRSK